MFRGEHINFLARLTLGQPAVCPRAIWTLTRAKSLCLYAFFSRTHVQLLVNFRQAGFCTRSETLLAAETWHKIARARFLTQSCSIVDQLLANSRQLHAPLEVAEVFLATPNCFQGLFRGSRGKVRKNPGKNSRPEKSWEEFLANGPTNATPNPAGLRTLSGSQGLT